MMIEFRMTDDQLIEALAKQTTNNKEELKLEKHTHAQQRIKSSLSLRRTSALGQSLSLEKVRLGDPASDGAALIFGSRVSYLNNIPPLFTQRSSHLHLQLPLLFHPVILLDCSISIGVRGVH